MPAHMWQSGSTTLLSYAGCGTLNVYVTVCSYASKYCCLSVARFSSLARRPHSGSNVRLVACATIKSTVKSASGKMPPLRASHWME